MDNFFLDILSELSSSKVLFIAALEKIFFILVGISEANVNVVRWFYVFPCEPSHSHRGAGELIPKEFERLKR